MQRLPELDASAGGEPSFEVSLVIPVCLRSPEEAPVAEAAAAEYVRVLEDAAARWELLLVPYAQAESEAVCARSAESLAGARACAPANGWGAAVSGGLRASTCSTLVYANYERTAADVLAEMLQLARREPPVVLRANRRTRDTAIQRAGSLLFNVECRTLLGIPSWDVNATPKLFPRAFEELLRLQRRDDLLDAEFCLACEQEGYPVIEVPIQAPLRAGLHARTPAYLSSVWMFAGVPRLRSRRPTGGRAQARTP
ncbi:MAG: hypothetical protein ACHQHO_02405 [Solirubrobacterales bacterium]